MFRNQSWAEGLTVLRFVGTFCGLSYFWDWLSYQLFLTRFVKCLLKENKQQKLWTFREMSNWGSSPGNSPPAVWQNPSADQLFLRHLLCLKLLCKTCKRYFPFCCQLSSPHHLLLQITLWKRNSDVCFQMKNDNPWVTYSSTLTGKL